jgi:hypothetical protein
VIRELDTAPRAFAYLEDAENYRFFELSDGRGPYGWLAATLLGPNLGLHLEVARYGPEVKRAMLRSREWLEEWAAACGAEALVGARPGHDPKWARFCELLGFTEFVTAARRPLKP